MGRLRVTARALVEWVLREDDYWDWDPGVLADEEATEQVSRADVIDGEAAMTEERQMPSHAAG